MSSQLDEAVLAAASVIRRGGVVAYPTEAVWGLGCDPFDKDAVARLWSLKARDPGKGLILIAATLEQMQPLIGHLGADQLAQLAESWPGPVTWLVPAGPQAPLWIMGDHRSIALRVTAHPVAAALCRAAGGPVVSTSANPQGRPPAKTQDEVSNYFGSSLEYILSGDLGGDPQPTEIKDLVTGSVIRPRG